MLVILCENQFFCKKFRRISQVPTFCKMDFSNSRVVKFCYFASSLLILTNATTTKIIMTPAITSDNFINNAEIGSNKLNKS